MGQRGDGLSLGSQPNGQGRDSLGIADRSTSRGFFLQLELPGSMVASEQLDSYVETQGSESEHSQQQGGSCFPSADLAVTITCCHFPLYSISRSTVDP